LVDEVALVAEVNCVWVITVKHKGRGRGARLGHVIKTQALILMGRRVMSTGHLLKPTIKRACAPSKQVSFTDLFDEVE
jgi:hypothetical protein